MNVIIELLIQIINKSLETSPSFRKVYMDQCLIIRKVVDWNLLRTHACEVNKEGKISLECHDYHQQGSKKMTDFPMLRFGIQTNIYMTPPY